MKNQHFLSQILENLMEIFEATNAKKAPFPLKKKLRFQNEKKETLFLSQQEVLENLPRFARKQTLIEELCFLCEVEQGGILQTHLSSSRDKNKE